MAKTRNTDTKTYIKTAVTKILSEKSFEELTVTNICRLAGINRGTFYLHYVDKYDMMDKLKAETLSVIYGIITEDTISLDYDVILRSLEFIHKDIDFISVIAKTTYVNMSQSIRDFIGQILKNVPDCEEWLRSKYKIPYQYAITAYMASIEALITQWITSDNPESPEVMSTIISTVAQ